MSTWEQLARIALYNGGAMLLGSGVADGAQFQAAIGGVIAIGSFCWWWYQNRRAKSEEKR